MKKRKYLMIMIFVFLLSAIGICISAEHSPLADKLVAGSPWQFTTKYEDTKMEFRFNPDGGFERWHSQKNRWGKQEISEGDKVVIKTMNDHTITLELDKEGNPMSTHSKHKSAFRSLKTVSQ